MADNESLQLRSLVFGTDVPANGVECEDLEKVVVADDSKKFFQVGAKLPL